MCYQRELLLSCNYKTDETIFLNLFEGTYNEFNVAKGPVTFIAEEEAPAPLQCTITSEFVGELAA